MKDRRKEPRPGANTKLGRILNITYAAIRRTEAKKNEVAKTNTR